MEPGMKEYGETNLHAYRLTRSRLELYSPTLFHCRYITPLIVRWELFNAHFCSKRF